MILGALILVAGLSNPYLDAVEALPQGYLEGGCRKPGTATPAPIEQAKEQLIGTYSWAIPTQTAIERIQQFSEGALVDFGAGTGYWSDLLAHAGANVVAIDDWSWGRPLHLWHAVLNGSFELLPPYKDRALMMVWPPRNDMPLRAVRAWDGARLVYVGEVLRSNGNPDLFNEFDSSWVLVDKVSIPQWWNRSDAVYLLTRGPARPWVDEELVCEL